MSTDLLSGARVSGVLELPSGHRLRWWESGNPDGPPLVLVHGGPGGRSAAPHRMLIDETRWRIVQYDQRGCGSSSPRGMCAANTTAHLIDDLERLRSQLGIARWTVLGFSWGTTVALLWAARYGTAADAVLLGSLYLARHDDLAVGRPHPSVQPDVWQDIVGGLAGGERREVAGAYLRRFQDPAHPDHRGAVQRWVALDMACAGLPYEPHSVVVEPGMAESVAIEAHYVANDFFLPAQGVLPYLDRIPEHVVLHVVQGVDDPIGSRCAEALAEALPRATVSWGAAGHSMLHPELRARMRAASDALLPADD